MLFPLALGGGIVAVGALTLVACDVRLWGFLYRVVRPIVFLMNSELAHDLVINSAALLRHVSPVMKFIRSRCWSSDPVLRTRLFNRELFGPIGLAAGMDSAGLAVPLFSSCGFAFGSIGTLTFKPCEGNQRPRLGRLAKSKSLLVWKGLRNPGVSATLPPLFLPPFPYALGVSIGPTNSLECATGEAQITDMQNSLKLMFDALHNPSHPLFASVSHLAYIELNISCPNNFGSNCLQQPETLRQLLEITKKIGFHQMNAEDKKEIWIKMPLAETWPSFQQLLDVILEFFPDVISGIILGNLCKNRESAKLLPEEVARCGSGNFSGAPCEVPSNRLIAKTYQYTQGKLPIIGCGGAFTAEQAYEKIRLGSCAVQLVSALVFNGIQAPADISRDLAEILKKDGFLSVAAAVGAAHRTREADRFLQWEVSKE